MNNIQCPNCMADYVISDEQLRLSQGKVRCGQCLEQFDAHAEINKEKPIFDPRDAFMEPLSHYEEEHLNVGIDDILPASRSVEFQDSSVSPVNVGEISPQELIQKNPLTPDESKVELNEILKQHARDAAKENKASKAGKISGDAPKLNVNRNTLSSLADNFDPELSVHLYDDGFTEDVSSLSNSAPFLDPSTGLNSLNQRVTEASIQFSNDYIEEPSVYNDGSEKNASNSYNRIEPQFDQVEIELQKLEEMSETIMLDEDNDTVEERPKELPPELSLQSKEESTNSIKKDTDLSLDIVDDLFPSSELDIATAKKPRILMWILSPFLLLLISVLAISFTYQLWQKQIISWPDHPEARSILSPVTRPVLEKLDELDIVLPERRSLSLLQLLSAKTEAHPTRSSTLLLRVSLINRAKIQQPLPWLELSLNNSDGKIISRRSLSPKDYIHNNRISDSINPNELKKVTIELLSFPKHAAGFELRLLNK